MLAVFEAVQAHIGSLDPPLRSHLFYAMPSPAEDLPPVSEVPYVVVETSTGGMPEDVSVGADPYQEFDFRVRYVTAVPDAPVKVRMRVRGLLGDVRQGPVRVPMAGRVLFTECLGAEIGSTADRDITFPQTNMHPFWGLDTFRAYSHPA